MHFFNCCHLSVAISVVQGFLGWFFVCVYSFVGEEAFLEFDSRLRDVNLVHIFNDVFKPCSSLPFFLIFFFFLPQLHVFLAAESTILLRSCPW